MIRFLLAVLIVASGCAAQGVGAAGGGGGDARDAANAGTANGVRTVRAGIDSFLQNPPAVVKGKRLGLITNHTGADGRGRSDVDALRGMQSVKLVALYAPEHGIRGDAAAGATIGDAVDEKTGLHVFSIYGELRKPSPAMLKDVDVLMFDIQDVGARCYTYVYSMALGMQAAKDKGIPFLVLDRPNPIGGDAVESNLLDRQYATFVGLYPIPMRHGMTVGELAQLFNREFGIGADLHVVKADGWRRSAWHDATAMPWVAPSPALPRLESAIHYPGTVAFEGTNLSVGRGTSHPFEQVGAPWLDPKTVIDAMDAAKLPGVRFEAVTFTPTAMGDKKFDNQLCHGVRLVCTDRATYQPVRTSAVLVDRIRASHPKEFRFRISHFDRLAGTDQLRGLIEVGRLDEFLKRWEADEARFRELRKPYLLYE